jgi:hypothetical protein
MSVVRECVVYEKQKNSKKEKVSLMEIGKWQLKC